MDPNTFKTRWEANGDRVVPLDTDVLQPMNLKLETTHFLATSGLPEDAAPYLSFSGDMYGRRMTDLFDDLDTGYSRFISLGFDGAGNRIAIDTDCNDMIVWLDHEDEFRSTFMNSSIAALAAFLLEIKYLIKLTISTRGDDAVLDQDFDRVHLDELMKRLNAIDHRALDEGNFWKMELQMFLGVSL